MRTTTLTTTTISASTPSGSSRRRARWVAISTEGASCAACAPGAASNTERAMGKTVHRPHMNGRRSASPGGGLREVHAWDPPRRSRGTAHPSLAGQAGRVGEPVTDHQLQLALGRFAAVAEVLLRDPGAWLGHDAPRPARQDRPEGAGRRLLAGVGAVAGTAGRGVRGGGDPGAPGGGAPPRARRAARGGPRIPNGAPPAAPAPPAA